MWIPLEDLNRTVLRTAVDDDMFDERIVLSKNTLNVLLEVCCLIQGGRYNRKLRERHDAGILSSRCTIQTCVVAPPPMKSCCSIRGEKGFRRPTISGAFRPVSTGQIEFRH